MRSTPARGTSRCGSAQGGLERIAVRDDGEGMSARGRAAGVRPARDQQAHRRGRSRGGARRSASAARRCPASRRSGAVRAGDATRRRRGGDRGRGRRAAGARAGGAAGAPAGTQRRGPRSVRDDARAAQVPAHAADRGGPRRRPAHAARGRVAGDGLPPRARRPRGAVAIRRCATCASGSRRCWAPSAPERWSSCDARGGGLAAARPSSGRRARSLASDTPGVDVSSHRGTAGPSPRRRALGARPALLMRAVLDGYESLLMRGRYPIAMLIPRACRRARSTSTCIRRSSRCASAGRRRSIS